MRKPKACLCAPCAAAKDPTHYLGMDALSWSSRALFFTGFDSFAAWEKEEAP